MSPPYNNPTLTMLQVLALFSLLTSLVAAAPVPLFEGPVDWKRGAVAEPCVIRANCWKREAGAEPNLIMDRDAAPEPEAVV